MQHVTPVISSVPVDRPRWRPHNIPDVQPLRLSSLVADPATAGLDLEDLAVLVMVPVGTGAGREHDVVHLGAVGHAHDGIRPDITRKGSASKLSLPFGSSRIANERHRHVGCGSVETIGIRDVQSRGRSLRNLGSAA